MAMYVFKATGKREGQNFVLLDKYQFVNGELVATGKDARAYKAILCDFYGCKVEKLAEPESEPTDPNDPDSEDEMELETTPATAKAAKPK